MKSTADQILQMLRAGEGKVYCDDLAKFGLYHRASARVNELNNKGYLIKFQKGKNWRTGKYVLLFDKDEVPRQFDRQGQRDAFLEEFI